MLNNIVYNSNKKTIEDIYVIIYAPRLQWRYIFWERNNSQTSMWSNPDNKYILFTTITNNDFQHLFSNGG